MSVMETTNQPKSVQAEYDFAVDGGAVSSITLRPIPGDIQGNEIPVDAVVVGGFLDITTAVLSATGTVALNSEAAADIMAATAEAGLVIAIIDVIPDSTGSTAIKMTAKRSIVMVIATAALTAGKFRVVLFYV